MNDNMRDELVTLCVRWRARARTFMADAEQARRGADMVRLTAMASTLEWTAWDLSFYLDAAPSSAPVLPLETREDEAQRK